jgi:hypothetical protein
MTAPDPDSVDADEEIVLIGMPASEESAGPILYSPTESAL